MPISDADRRKALEDFGEYLCNKEIYLIHGDALENLDKDTEDFQETVEKYLSDLDQLRKKHAKNQGS